jgi:hypothetical protein
LRTRDGDGWPVLQARARLAERINVPEITPLVGLSGLISLPAEWLQAFSPGYGTAVRAYLGGRPPACAGGVFGLKVTGTWRGHVRERPESTCMRMANMARAATRVALVVMVAAAMPFQALAHVKWFSSSVDVSGSPTPLAEVITPIFAACFCVFAVMIFFGFLVDHWVTRRWPAFESSGELHAGAEGEACSPGDRSIFSSPPGTGAERSSRQSFRRWAGLVQFAIAVLVIWRLTCILAAFGMLVLCGYGIAEYGVFHMIDYVSFLGIAAFLALTSTGSPHALRMRGPLMVGALAFSVMWTAVEKFVYPQWAISVLLEHPN